MPSFKNTKKIIQTIRYGRGSGGGNDIVEAELRSMAVGKGEMDKGVGGRVVATLESFLKETGKAGKYKVVTSARDARSNGFYKKAGFSFVKVFKHHNDLNEYHKSL